MSMFHRFYSLLPASYYLDWPQPEIWIPKFLNHKPKIRECGLWKTMEVRTPEYGQVQTKISL